jgi:hypothetical protein
MDAPWAQWGAATEARLRRLEKAAQAAVAVPKLRDRSAIEAKRAQASPGEDEVIEEVTDLLAKGQFTQAIVKLGAELISLARTVELLKNKTTPNWRGYWDETETYAPGDVVFLGGSSWIANITVKAKPTTQDSMWSLFARSGRDGKSKPNGKVHDLAADHARERAAR